MPELLRRTVFGNPILRQHARRLSKAEILAPKTQAFIENMFYTLEKKKYGVGLAAPQVGESIALAVLGIKPTPTRQDLQPLRMVIINPEITHTHGRRTGMWEACISGGMDKDFLYGKTLRYKKITLRWLDEQAKQHTKDFAGLTAHIIQHEVDHLNGVLFVDRVRDSKTYMLASEYIKRVVRPAQKKRIQKRSENK